MSKKATTRAYKCISCGKPFWTPKSLKHHPCPGRIINTGQVVLNERSEETLARIEREQQP